MKRSFWTRPRPVGNSFRVKRVIVFTAFLFVFSQLLSQMLIDRWPMHSAYKNLPAWIVDDVWRPLFWRNDEKADR